MPFIVTVDIFFSKEHLLEAKADIVLRPLYMSKSLRTQRGKLEQISDAETDAVAFLAFSKVETATRPNNLSLDSRVF